MAFYVAVVLLAALFVAVERESGRLLALVWGTTLGLAVAHLFAFRLAAVLVGRGSAGSDTWSLAGAQLAGAALVGLLVTVAVLVIPGDDRAEVARFSLAAFVGLSGYAIGRSAGASQVRSVGFAMGVLVLATAVAGIKYALTH